MNIWERLDALLPVAKDQESIHAGLWVRHKTRDLDVGLVLRLDKTREFAFIDFGETKQDTRRISADELLVVQPPKMDLKIEHDEIGGRYTSIAKVGFKVATRSTGEVGTIVGFARLACRVGVQFNRYRARLYNPEKLVFIEANQVLTSFGRSA